MEEKLFEDIKQKLDLLDKEIDKTNMKELIISIIVDLERFCHRDDINIHMVLAGAREKCKKEIDKSH
jgi:hypothetical protein